MPGIEAVGDIRITPPDLDGDADAKEPIKAEIEGLTGEAVRGYGDVRDGSC